MHIYGSVDPLECIFIALLALFNEGGTSALFFSFDDTYDEAPERKKIAPLAL